MADNRFNFSPQLTPNTESPSPTVATGSSHDAFAESVNGSVASNMSSIPSAPSAPSVPSVPSMPNRSNTTHVSGIANVANLGGSIKRSNSADIIRSNGSSGGLGSAHPLPSTSAHSITNHSHSHHHHHHHGAGSAQAAAAAQPMPPLPGATIYTPTAPPSSEMNPRSCVTCRRRKVRCDKLMPCTNCRRALVPCVFPAPERAPRRPRRKDPNAALAKPHQSSEREIELLKRLRKLEGIVEELSGQVELEAGSSSGKIPPSSSTSPEATGASAGDATASNSNSGQHQRSSMDHTGNTPSASSSWGHSPKPANATLSNPPSASGGSPGRLVSRSGSVAKKTKDTQKQFGRLMINDYGKSRYVSSAFWSKINDELDDLRAETHRISDESESEASDTESSPAQHEDERPVADHHAFIFGFQSTAVDLRPLHPLPSQIPYIWQVYQENVDPVIKILHIPSTTKLIRNARTNLDNIAPAAEALMFAIYYAAVNSLEESEIQINFMAEKSVLINKYRFALEQALAKANFLVSSDLVTLQAFVLLLVLVRRQEDTRFAWTLTGLAIRISHSIGLHRDGTNFPNLSPFEIEMRRRVFWALCILDMRCAEDQGTDLMILEQGVDTRPPLNINDTDISPESTSLPPAREGSTDMTFALIRFEICRVARRLHAIHSAMGPFESGDSSLTLEDRERMIHEVYDRVENLYLKHGDPNSNPMFWVAANIARVICAKMTLVIYQPILFPGPANENMSRAVRDRLFTASTELFEYSYILTMDPRTKQWRWLFQTYTQWQAVAYVLIESARRPWSASVERAWHALNQMMMSPKPHDLERMADNASLFVPLKALYNKSRKHRSAELERLRGDIDEISHLDKEDRSRLNPTMFSAYHGHLDGLQWRERWLALVGAPQLIDEPEMQQQQQQQQQQMTTDTNGDSTNMQLQQQLPQPLQSYGQQQQQQQQQQFPLVPGQQKQQGPDCPANVLNHVFSQPTFEAVDLMPFLSLKNVDTSTTGPGSSNIAAGSNGTNNFNVNTAATGNATGDINMGGPASVFGTFAGADMPRQDPSLASYVAGGNTNNVGQVSSNGAADGTPLVNAMVKDYPPPWLWTGDEANSLATQYSSVLADDTDMKMDEMDEMDENFDWQDFGQTLGGMSNGVWSSHGL